MRLPVNERSRDDLMYQHFHSPGHDALEDLSVQIIDKVNNERDLLDKDGQ